MNVRSRIKIRMLDRQKWCPQLDDSGVFLVRVIEKAVPKLNLGTLCSSEINVSENGTPNAKPNGKRHFHWHQLVAPKPDMSARGRRV